VGSIVTETVMNCDGSAGLVSNSVQEQEGEMRERWGEMEGEMDSFMRDRSRRQLCVAPGPRQIMQDDGDSLDLTEVQPGKAVQVDRRLIPG